MATNKIYCIDVLEGLKMLEDNSIDLIITSPPYNKIGLNGNCKGAKWNKTIDYNGDPNNDNMTEEEYKEWQLQILKECYRVLKDDGSMFYNHKNRIVKGKGCISSPWEWLLQSPFLVRQEIIWNRKNGPNQDPSRFVPCYEQIYWLTKQPKVNFRRIKDIEHTTDIWTINPDRKNNHPAPFPIEIANNIIPNIGENLIVLDPFMGSGTTAIAALRNNCQYIGFEKFPQYVEMAEQRIREYGEEL